MSLEPLHLERAFAFRTGIFYQDSHAWPINKLKRVINFVSTCEVPCRGRSPHRGSLLPLATRGLHGEELTNMEAEGHIGPDANAKALTDKG